jgi:hypothetical protein
MQSSSSSIRHSIHAKKDDRKKTTEGALFIRIFPAPIPVSSLYIIDTKRKETCVYQPKRE